MNQTLPALVLGALSGVALASQAADIATVVSSTPVVVNLQTLRRVCTDEQQVVQPRPSGAGAVIGAIAGGALGHNIGGGLITGVAAVAGSLIGNQIEADTTPLVAVPVRSCRNASSLEPRIVGYDVMYDYAGQRYSTRMTRDPGTQMAIELRPAAASGEAVPAPAAGDAPFAQAPGAVVYEPVSPIGAAAPQVVYAAPYPYGYPYGYGYGYGYPYPFIAPVISFGFGYYGGYYGGHRGRWR